MLARFAVILLGLAMNFAPGIKSAVSAEVKIPAAPDILFSRPHLSSIDPGAAVKYKFERVVSDSKKLNAGFVDDIELGVEKVDPKSGKREVKIQVFTGERGRPVQTITGMTGNPILVVFLDRIVNNYRSVAGGNRPYLKNQVRSSLADGAKVEAVKVDYQGKKVDGHRITVRPFLEDKNRLKMLGYEGSTFTFTYSNEIPGELYSLESNYESSLEDAPKMSEKIVFAEHITSK